MAVDISFLTVEKALAIAIRSEIDAEKVYERMLKMVKNFTLKDKLRFLVEEERKHQQVVKALYKKVSGSKEAKPAEKSIAPRLSVSIEEENNLIDLLELAVDAELEAEEFYDKLADEVEERGVQDILRYLSSMEHGHYALLKGELELCQQNETYYEKDGFHYDMVHIGP